MNATVTRLFALAVVVSLFAIPVAGAGGNSITATDANETTTPTPTTTDTPEQNDSDDSGDVVEATIEQVNTRLLNLQINTTRAEVRQTTEELAAQYPRADRKALVPLVVQELRQADDRESSDDVQAVDSGPNVTESGETIDASTTLVDKRLDDGEAVLTIHSQTDQSILVWDAAAMWLGEQPAERQVMVNAGETVKIRLPVTTYQNGVLVGLDANAEDTRYPIRFSGITATFDWLDWMASPIALLVGAFATTSSFGAAGLWKLWVEGGEPVIADG